MYVQRIAPISNDLENRSVLLLGPRRSGKSAFIRNEIKPDRVYNLLHADVFQRLSARPSLIREELRPGDRLVVVDEIQKLPVLLDEIHGLIEERGAKFLLTGSSARKLRTAHTSLMAGRAKARHLHPFVSAEIPGLDLARVLLNGTLPPVYLSEDPQDELRSYVGQYLQEEIRAEALARNIESFSRFLHTAALTNAEIVNFESVARDAQVPARTVREYYQLLSDTLIGHLLLPLQLAAARPSRKAVSRARFYLFDLGVTHQLQGRTSIPEGSDEFGKAFESFIALELLSYISYRAPDEHLRFYRSQTGIEVDFVLGDHTGIEVKATRLGHERDGRGLAQLDLERPLRNRFLVTRDPHRRTMSVRGRTIEVVPWREFLEILWSGGF